MTAHRNPQEISTDISSFREFSWRTSSSRFQHLEEDPKKAPMNPEEVQLLKEGNRLMEQAKMEAAMPIQRNAVPENKKRKLFSFRRSKLRIFPTPKKE